MNTAFDYVDRLFNGLVYFVLNLIESIISLYKNPVRGTLRLTARSLNVNIRQASYRTLLFFLNAATYVAVGSAGRSKGESFIENIVSVSERPNLISAIIYSTLATTFIELYIKRRRLAGRSNIRRTNLFQTRLGYAFCFIASLLFVLQIAWLFSTTWMPDEIHPVYLTGLLIPILFFAGTAAITPIIRMPAVIGAFFVLVLGQFISGMAAGTFLIATTTKQSLDILTLNCRDEGQGRIGVAATLINRTEDVMIIHFPDNIRLFDGDYKPDKYNISSPEAKPYIIVEPRKTAWLEFKADYRDSGLNHQACHLWLDATPNTTQEFAGSPRSTHQFRAMASQPWGR